MCLSRFASCFGPQGRSTGVFWWVLAWCWIASLAFAVVEPQSSVSAARKFNTGAWSAALPLDAGAQSLEARAAHPSGHYTATATSSFTVSVPLAALSTAYDAEGNVTSRTFADGRVQTLTWDAFNQLVRVTERDAANNGYDWSAVYDGLGRRLRTIHQPVAAGSASGPATTITSLYDPAAEFLEIAVIVNGAVAWKVHGPDLDGRTPVVDRARVNHFLEDAGLLGERIPMHHIRGTPITTPLPATRHMDAHMPGGFRYNPGGPGGQVPIYPATTP